MNLTKLSSYNYDLPKELIAQTAYNPADECKLLYYKDWEIKDLIFKDILDFLDENHILFFNNSKVVKARITGDVEINGDLGDNIKFYMIDEKGNKRECKNCEILFLKKVEWNTFEALVRPGKKFKVWRKFDINGYIFEVVDFTKEWRLIKLHSDEDIFDVLEKLWQMPLPPYISYSKEKETPYQPVQAKKEGSVAAPTASLHFTKELFEKLEEKWVWKLESTLHIGMWTFKTVDVEDITDYDIHSETVEIPLDIFKKLGEAKEQWKKVVAVGTTWTRILESLPYLWVEVGRNSEEIGRNLFFKELAKDISDEEVKKFIASKPVISNGTISFDTKLYIYPWFKYKLVDKLITNFHLPKSSLLMLVAAFMWYENMMKAYKHAVENKYRFFSFGDAMFIENI